MTAPRDDQAALSLTDATDLKSFLGPPIHRLLGTAFERGWRGPCPIES